MQKESNSLANSIFLKYILITSSNPYKNLITSTNTKHWCVELSKRRNSRTKKKDAEAEGDELSAAADPLQLIGGRLINRILVEDPEGMNISPIEEIVESLAIADLDLSVIHEVLANVLGVVRPRVLG